MNRMRIAYPVVFCLLFAALAYARPQQEEPNSHEAAAPSQQQPEAKPEGPERQAKPEKSEKEKEANPDKRSEREQPGEEKEANPSSKSEREAATGQEQNRASAQARPAGKSAHIPDNRFRANFGRQHSFKVSRPIVVNNRQTILYGGYNFVLVDAWPAAWAYTDDVYIDYIDGDYFLFDLLHPWMRIALFVVE